MNKQELVTQGEAGTVYILHLDSKLNGTAGHYIGWARELENRLYHHRKGSGARFTRAANIAGIQYSIAADWPGTRNLERAIKNAKNHKLFCPICMGEKAKNPLEVKWRTHTKRNKLTQDVEESGVSNHTTDEDNVEQEASFEGTCKVYSGNGIDFTEMPVAVYHSRPDNWIADKDRFWTDI